MSNNLKTPIMNLGKLINNLRVDRMKQTQNVFAENIFITQTYLSQIENNQKTPSQEVLLKISGYVDIPVAIMCFMAIEESDINESKLEAFRVLKPSVDDLISEFIY